MTLVYEELRTIATIRFRSEHPGHTLQPTAVVHEAFLRLVDQDRVQWKGRAHFLGIAAQMVRRVLVDHARAKHTGKRGHGLCRVEFDDSILAPEQNVHDLISLSDAMDRLKSLDARQGHIADLRFFGGLTSEEITEVTGLSKSTVDRAWRTARAWLRRELSEST